MRSVDQTQMLMQCLLSYLNEVAKCDFITDVPEASEQVSGWLWTPKRKLHNNYQCNLKQSNLKTLVNKASLVDMLNCKNHNMTSLGSCSA